MKNIALAIALAAASFASGMDTRYVEIKSTNDVHAIASIPEWRRGVDTNGVTITVCIGGAVISGGPLCYPLSRELEFDADGRLVRASPVMYMQGVTTRGGRHDGPISDVLLESFYRWNPESAPPDERRNRSIRLAELMRKQERLRIEREKRAQQEAEEREKASNR